MTIAFFTDPSLARHRAGPHHPERPERLHAIVDGATAGATLELVDASPLSVDDARLVHTDAQQASLHALRGIRGAIDADTVVSEESVELAYRAAGLVAAATKHTHARRAPTFAAVRPPGHHAEPDRAMGFCLLSNVAIAAALMVRDHDARVLVVDFDVHHGNGTERAFVNDPRVLVFNTHEHGNYPGTGSLHDVGTGDGRGFNINVPLPAHTRDGCMAHVYESVLVPVAEKFRPTMVLVSAGYDGHQDDPLGHFDLTSEGFGRLTSTLLSIARRHADGRLMLATEGGYDLAALSSSVKETVRVLDGGTAAPSANDDAPSSDVVRIVDAVKAAHPWWFGSA